MLSAGLQTLAKVTSPVIPAQAAPGPQLFWVVRQCLPGQQGSSSEAKSDTLSPKGKTLGLEFIVQNLAGLEPSV